MAMHSTLGSRGLEAVAWKPRVGELGVNIPYVVGDLARDYPDKRQVHISMGLGEQDAPARAAVATLEGLGLPAVAFWTPYTEIAPCNLEWAAREVAPMVARALGKESVSWLGTSRGCISVGMAASEEPEMCDTLGLLSTAWLTNSFLGATTGKRAMTLFKELAVRNTFRQDLDRSHLGIVRSVVAEVGHAVCHGQVKERLDFFLSPKHGEMMLEGIIAGAKDGRPTRFFAANDDPLYRPAYLHEVLGGVGCSGMVQIVEGPHTSMVSTKGKNQLIQVGEWVQSVWTQSAVMEASVA